MEEVAGALARVDREVGPCGRADEERVAVQDDAARDEGDVLGTMTGRVQHAYADRAGAQLGPVLERLEGIVRARVRMDRDLDPVVECESAVP